MELLNLQKTADCLEGAATITETNDELGVAIVHRGTTPDGSPFVLINGCNGSSLLLTSI